MRILFLLKLCYADFWYNKPVGFYDESCIWADAYPVEAEFWLGGNTRAKI